MVPISRAVGIPRGLLLSFIICVCVHVYMSMYNPANTESSMGFKETSFTVLDDVFEKSGW